MGAKANHHYVPQFYLRNFAEGVGRKARVAFFDEVTGRLDHTLVRNIGSKRYFNRVEAEGHDPDHVENALAKLEGEISGPLAEVIISRGFPSAEHFSYVMNLAALLSVRNPRMRGQMEHFHQKVVEKTFGLLVSSKEIWEHQTRKMKEEGVDLSEDVTYEDIKRFKDGKNYSINIDQTHMIGLEFELVPPILETLANRNWCFAAAPAQSQYITSDHPVVLTWADDARDSRFPVGHGIRETRILFPLSSDCLLIGLFEDAPESILHTTQQVCSANTLIARHSQRQIYARSAEFEVNLRGQMAVKGEDLPQYFGREGSVQKS